MESHLKRHGLTPRRIDACCCHWQWPTIIQSVLRALTFYRAVNSILSPANSTAAPINLDDVLILTLPAVAAPVPLFGRGMFDLKLGTSNGTTSHFYIDDLKIDDIVSARRPIAP